MTFKILVVLPFCVALAIQGFVCAAVLAGSNIFGQMEADSYALFSERVSSRAGYLENDMVFRWSDLNAVSESISGDITQILSENNASSSDIAAGSSLALSILDTSADDLVTLARSSEVDGVFLVLVDDVQAEGEADVRSALYIRDSSPKVDIEGDSDLMLASCPLSLGRRLGIALDTQWSASFPLEPEGEAASAFYYEPLRAAERYPHAKTADLGYWGRPTNFGWAGSSSITYSVPLRDATGAVCAVLGVEVRVDRLSTFFPYSDLGAGGEGSYLLAVTNEEGGFSRDGGVEPQMAASRVYDVLAYTGATQSLYVQDESFQSTLDGRGLMSIDPVSEDVAAGRRAVAAATEITLYDSTSPFAGEHWALVGLEPEDDLFSASRSLADNLVRVFVASIVVSLAVAILCAWLSSSRVRNLMKEVRAARPEQPISFTSTGIVEVDELSDAIEALGTEVSSAASRLSQILRMSDRSIGAFEYNKATGTVSYTDGFFATLSVLEPSDSTAFDSTCPTKDSLSVEEFSRFMHGYDQHIEIEDGQAGRYLISGASRLGWVRLVVMPDDGAGRVFGLVENVTHEIETRRRIEHERDHDILTGLLNRRAFEQEVTRLLACDPPAQGTMLMLDLDNLKFINDTYGHDWGDQYIKAAGRAVAAVFQGNGFCSRVSGDEFLVFASGCGGGTQIEGMFEEFCRTLDESVLEAPDGTVLKVRASMGTARYPDDASDYARLREYADFAMYTAKNSRKGELVAFDRANYDEKAYILNRKEDLNRLLDERLVDYHFQPIVDVHTAEVVAYEALMRPQLESISTPDRVLAIARSQSKLYRVEQLTFFGALDAYARFSASTDRALFVNSIATQRLSADDERILCDRHGGLLKRLVIEIIESDYSRDMAVYKEALAARFGARLAIDDFGSGYNGETSLLDYHVDFVKLDADIVRGIETAKDQQDIARNLIGYAHDRGIRVVAEGVETEAELRAVFGLGADYVQGYLLGRPAPEPGDISDESKRLIRKALGEA